MMNREFFARVHLVGGLHGARLILLPLCAALCMVGCRSGEATSTTTAAAEVEVEAAVVREAPITEHIFADAVLAPIAQAAISPRITAPVAKFYVQRGSRVKAGQLLASLESKDLQAAVAESGGSYEAARATYQTTTKAQVPEDYQRAELDLDQAKASLDLNRKIVESRTQLYAQGALPGRELDTAQAALVQAQAAFDSAQKHLAGMREVGREAAIKGAQGQLESAKGRYLGSQAQLSYSEVRSPINGVVTERALFTGETAAAGAPLLTVMDTSALLAKVHLPQLHAQLLKVGSPAEATIPGVDGPVEGEVTLISPALDPGSTTVEVWVRIENPKGTFKPGGAAKVSLEGKTVARALVAPSEAVLSMPSGKKAVMTIGADGAAHRSEVETGIADDGFVQIVSGIKAGARVVTKGAYSLDDDTRVKVVAPSDDKDGDTKAPEDKPASGHDSGATK